MRIEIDRVSVTFDGPVPVEAVKDCTLTVGTESYVSLKGRSGAGKTTLLSVLGLLAPPTGGQVRVDGRAVVPSAVDGFRRGRIGFVFQSSNLFVRRSALANVAMAHEYALRKGRRAAQDNARLVLERVGLAHRADANVETLSGGEQRRVAVARAMVFEPEILICDEPTGNLDDETALTVIELIESLLPDTGVVMATHDTSLANRADLRFRMANGQLSMA